MKSLQGKLAGTDVQLVSVSVDPEHDSPAVLARYASSLQADPERWWFLTGPKASVRGLVFEQFKLSVADATPDQQALGSEDVIHSTRLALVDRGNRVVAYYDADSPAEVDEIQHKAAKLSNPWASRLPTWNASLNGACAVLLLIGWFQIRCKRVAAHRVTMATALAVSTVFLASYLIYHFLVVRGSVPFQGVGRPIRVAYFTILLSHTVLAIAMVPLVIMTVLHALRGRFDRHRLWSTITFPIWLYVSVTGVVVYFMLYQMDFSNPALAGF
jgi:protein SCO1/2/putative membrane protein